MNNNSTKRNKPRLHDNSYLRKIRKALGINIQDFSDLTGLKKDRLARLERGESRMRPEEKRQLAARLNVPEEALEHFDPASGLSISEEKCAPSRNTGQADEVKCAACAAKDSEIEHLRRLIYFFNERLVPSAPGPAFK